MTRHAVRAATEADYPHMLRLMRVLMGDLPVLDGTAGQARFREILRQPGTTVFLADGPQVPVSTATLHMMPNLTHGGRPYALVENVVTDPAARGQGAGRAVMAALQDHAWAQDAYKIMLLTGQDSGARGFYEALGYSAEDKTGLTMRRAPRRAPQPR